MRVCNYLQDIDEKLILDAVSESLHTSIISQRKIATICNKILWNNLFEINDTLTNTNNKYTIAASWDIDIEMVRSVPESLNILFVIIEAQLRKKILQDGATINRGGADYGLFEDPCIYKQQKVGFYAFCDVIKNAKEV